MHIVGVTHVGDPQKLLEKLDSISGDPFEVALLELPSNKAELMDYSHSPYFEEIEKHLLEKGTRVIPGDIPLQLSDSVKNSIDSLIEGNLNKYQQYHHTMKLVGANISDLIKNGAIDCFITHRRDNNFQKRIIEENPDLVIVGNLHAKWLSKRFPDAVYHKLSNK